MLTGSRTINPRFPAAPAWMSDGRLFTDYRPNCSLVGSQSNASYDVKERLQSTGTLQINTDRSLTVMQAGSTGCVDTVLPEVTERVCEWDGCRTRPGYANGLGQGRLYVTRPAAGAAFQLPGTFPMNSTLYAPGPTAIGTVGPMKLNRYSAPYGE